MEALEKIRTLQAIYAGVLADSVLRLGNEGVLENVTIQKRAEQLAGGKARAIQLGITCVQEVFEKLSDLTGCANWTTSEIEDSHGFNATASRCALCALAKKIGADSPCRIYCLDPMEGMVKGLDEGAGFYVESTLYDSSECHIRVLSGGWSGIIE